MTLALHGYVAPGPFIRDAATTARELAAVKATGANALVFDVNLMVDAMTGNTVRLKYPILPQVEDAMKQAAAAGLDVWFKPLVEAGTGSDFLNWQRLAPSNPQQWFASYKEQLLGLAAMAQRAGASHFLLTNELYSMTTNAQYQPYWADLIAGVRSVFSGRIGFNAGGLLGGENEFLDIADSLYALVDFVGISAYPRLSSAAAPTREMLEAGWTQDASGFNLDALMQQLFARNQLPVYFTEMGAPPYVGGSAQQGANIGKPIAEVLDLAGQKLFYDVVLAHVEKYYGQRVQGIFLYNWLLDGQVSNPERVVGSAYDWSLAGKPALADVTAWFTGARQYDPLYLGTRAPDTIFGGSQDDTFINSAGRDTLHGGAGNDLFIATRVAASAPVLRLVISGDILDGVAPLLGVWVNGSKVSSIQLAPVLEGRNASDQPFTTKQVFEVTLPAAATVTELRISHDNDQYFGAGRDRNAYLWSASLDGSTVSADGSRYVPAHGAAVERGWSLFDSGNLLLDPAQINTLLVAGSDVRNSFDGGEGRDTVRYGVSLASASISRAADGVVTVKSGDAILDTLTSIERLQFTDARVALDIAGNGGMAYRLYQAAFNRTPDQGGLGFQMKALDDGLNIAQVAANFIASPEFTATYGALDNTKFVTQLYANVLHRAPDASGLAFHVNNLSTGANTRANVLVGFSESPENQAALIGSIQNGMVYSV